MNKTTVAITGASGYIGSNLLRALAPDHKIIALYRGSPPVIEGICEGAEIEWREVDFFSMSSSVNAMKGVDYAFYLIHSMLPTTRLFQGNFADTDLLLADNFVRACSKNKVKQIIYLGGLVPVGDRSSHHLVSREEVEGVLKSSTIPYTLFRASMVVGKGGSSFEIMRHLVLNLPVMLLPKWTKNNTQTIYIGDVMRVLRTSVGNSSYFNKTENLVNGEILTYKDLLYKTAKGLELKRTFIPFPFHLTQLSKRWVSFFGHAHINLVSPLVDSLRVNLPTPLPSELIEHHIKVKKYDRMIELVQNAYQQCGRFKKKKRNRIEVKENSVRSVQRLPSCRYMSSSELSKHYMIFLPKLFKFLIKAKVTTEGKCQFFFSFLKHPILELTHIEERSDDHRHLFYITGGLLVKRKNYGWLDFRQIDNRRYTLAVIHEFIPSLPWPIYRLIQAPVHRFVMYLFGKYLERQQRL